MATTLTTQNENIFSQATTVAGTVAIPHVQPFAVFLEIAGSERSQSLDTCSPETVHSAGHSPPGSGRTAATPEPSSKRWEPALCPPSAGSRSVGCDSLFWSQHNNKKCRSGTSWAQICCTHNLWTSFPGHAAATNVQSSQIFTQHYQK